MKKFTIYAAALLISGSAFANNAENAQVAVGDTGLPPGPAMMDENSRGGPATGPDAVQTPKELAGQFPELGTDNLGEIINFGMALGCGCTGKYKN